MSKWRKVEHSWSDTSIYDGEKVVCTKSIRCEATPATQEVLEKEVSDNFDLIQRAPEMANKIKQLEEENDRFGKWKNVNHELPEENEKVLVYKTTYLTGIRIGYCYTRKNENGKNEVFWCVNGTSGGPPRLRKKLNPTLWMELPEKPSENQTKEE